MRQSQRWWIDCWKARRRHPKAQRSGCQHTGPLGRRQRSQRTRLDPRLSLECRPYQPLQSGTAMGLTGSRNEGSKSIARPSSVSPSVVLKQKEALFISRFIFCRRLPHINPPLLGVLCSAPLCHRRRSCLCLPSLKNEALDLASLHFCRRRPPLHLITPAAIRCLQHYDAPQPSC